MPLILFSQLKSVEMAQKQNCCVSDMGQMIPQIRSTTTTKTKSTDPSSGFALEKAAGWKFHKKAVTSEQATIKLRELKRLGVGTNHLEFREKKLRGEFRSGVDRGRSVNRIIEALNDKIKDSEICSSKWRSTRTSWRKDMENKEVFEKGKVKNLIKDLQMRASTLRNKLITKNNKSIAHLVKKWKVDSKDDSEQVRPELEGFEGLSAMTGDFIEKEPEEDIVLVIGDIELNDNEKKVLSMNPKFGVYTEIDLEEVVKDIAVGGVKTRWHKQSNPELYEDPARLGVELGVQVNDPPACEAEMSVRHPYDFDTNSIRLTNRRATDCKQNTYVHLPRANSVKLETEISVKNSSLLKIATETKEAIENTSNKGQNLAYSYFS